MATTQELLNAKRAERKVITDNIDALYNDYATKKAITDWDEATYVPTLVGPRRWTDIHPSVYSNDKARRDEANTLYHAAYGAGQTSLPPIDAEIANLLTRLAGETAAQNASDLVEANMTPEQRLEAQKQRDAAALAQKEAEAKARNKKIFGILAIIALVIIAIIYFKKKSKLA